MEPGSRTAGGDWGFGETSRMARLGIHRETWHEMSCVVCLVSCLPKHSDVGGNGGNL